MQPLKAHVRKGRLLLDEPTDLPEGQEVELVPVDDVLARGGDYLDDEERAELEQAIEEGLADAREGRHEDAAVVMARLRTRRANPLHKAG
jgi:hypothetical protein